MQNSIIGQPPAAQPFDNDIQQVLSDLENARLKFSANSPTYQRIAGRLTRDYVRLAQKRERLHDSVVCGQEG